MNFKEIRALDDAYVLHSYGRIPVALDHGKGCEAWDVEGKHYYDFTSGIGVNAFGYCDDGWVRAVTEQAGRIQHMSNYYYCEKNALLAEALMKASGMRRAFFCNSGAEANECAIKVARRFGEKMGAHKIVTLKNSFHGRTITTLAANGQDAFHEYFLPLTEGFVYAEANNVADLEQKLDGTVCAVLLESVQGEGGVIPLDADYLRAVRALCDERGVLLMLDEVQTGVGRTGYFFSYQGCGVQPDVVTAAKGLGLPRLRRAEGHLHAGHERLDLRLEPGGERRRARDGHAHRQCGFPRRRARKGRVLPRGALEDGKRRVRSRARADARHPREGSRRARRDGGLRQSGPADPHSEGHGALPAAAHDHEGRDRRGP